MRIYHLIPAGTWPVDGDYRPASLASEGFVHFSYAEQVAGSANRHYAEAPALEVVEFDASGFEVVVENGFPHVYSAIDSSLAVSIRPLTRDASGAWVMDDGAGAPASPGR